MGPLRPWGNVSLIWSLLIHLSRLNHHIESLSPIRASYRWWKANCVDINIYLCFHVQTKYPSSTASKTLYWKTKQPLSLTIRSERLTSLSWVFPSLSLRWALRIGSCSGPSMDKWMFSADPVKPSPLQLKEPVFCCLVILPPQCYQWLYDIHQPSLLPRHSSKFNSVWL